jgi:hypothetical protein
VSVATIEPGWAGLLAEPEPVRSLDDVLVGLWVALTSGRAVTCPVCGEEMRPDDGAHARPRGGRCDSCAADLT